VPTIDCNVRILPAYEVRTQSNGNSIFSSALIRPERINARIRICASIAGRFFLSQSYMEITTASFILGYTCARLSTNVASELCLIQVLVLTCLESRVTTRLLVNTGHVGEGHWLRLEIPQQDPCCSRGRICQVHGSLVAVMLTVMLSSNFQTFGVGHTNSCARIC